MKRAMQRRAWLASYQRSALRPSAEILTCCEMRSRRTWAPSDSSARTESSWPSRGSTCAMCLRAIITLFLRRFSLSSRAASFWRCTIDRSKPCSDDDDSRDRDDADESDSRRRPAEYRALLRGEAIIPRIDRVRVRAIESAIIASVTEFQPQLLVVAFFSCSLITSPSVRPLSSLDSMVTLADAASRSLCHPGTRRVSAAGERCWWQRFYPTPQKQPGFIPTANRRPAPSGLNKRGAYRSNSVPVGLAPSKVRRSDHAKPTTTLLLLLNKT